MKFNKCLIRRLTVATLFFLIVYVGSYALLYRRGMKEVEEYGYKYFFYVPAGDILKARGCTMRHMRLLMIYEPLNELHQDWLGGRSACYGICFDLLSHEDDPPRPEENATAE